jgi:hypothetical protein
LRPDAVPGPHLLRFRRGNVPRRRGADRQALPATRVPRRAHQLEGTGRQRIPRPGAARLEAQPRHQDVRRDDARSHDIGPVHPQLEYRGLHGADDDLPGAAAEPLRAALLRRAGRGAKCTTARGTRRR